MKRSPVRVGLALLGVAAVLVIFYFVMQARVDKQLNIAGKMQPLVVIIANELNDYRRLHHAYPVELGELKLERNADFVAIAGGPPDLSLFDYQSDGRTFRLRAKNSTAVQGFSGDLKDGLSPIHPNQ